MPEQLKCPPGLGVSGRRLWRQVAADASEQGLELTPIERFWLRSACKLTDQAAVVEAELAGGGQLRVKGSMGQLVADPLLAELRQLHLAINLTLARIKTDVPESSSPVVSGPRSVAARSAANVRWRGAGA